MELFLTTCTNCGKQFEKQQAADHKAKCPALIIGNIDDELVSHQYEPPGSSQNSQSSTFTASQASDQKHLTVRRPLTCAKVSTNKESSSCFIKLSDSSVVFKAEPKCHAFNDSDNTDDLKTLAPLTIHTEINQLQPPTLTQYLTSSYSSSLVVPGSIPAVLPEQPSEGPHITRSVNSGNNSNSNINGSIGNISDDGDDDEDDEDEDDEYIMDIIAHLAEEAKSNSKKSNSIRINTNTNPTTGIDIGNISDNSSSDEEEGEEMVDTEVVIDREASATSTDAGGAGAASDTAADTTATLNMKEEGVPSVSAVPAVPIGGGLSSDADVSIKPEHCHAVGEMATNAVVSLKTELKTEPASSSSSSSSGEGCNIKSDNVSSSIVKTEEKQEANIGTSDVAVKPEPDAVSSAFIKLEPAAAAVADKQLIYKHQQQQQLEGSEVDYCYNYWTDDDDSYEQMRNIAAKHSDVKSGENNSRRNINSRSVRRHHSDTAVTHQLPPSLPPLTGKSSEQSITECGGQSDSKCRGEVSVDLGRATPSSSPPPLPQQQKPIIRFKRSVPVSSAAKANLMGGVKPIVPKTVEVKVEKSKPTVSKSMSEVKVEHCGSSLSSTASVLPSPVAIKVEGKPSATDEPTVSTASPPPPPPALLQRNAKQSQLSTPVQPKSPSITPMPIKTSPPPQQQAALLPSRTMPVDPSFSYLSSTRIGKRKRQVSGDAVDDDTKQTTKKATVTATVTAIPVVVTSPAVTAPESDDLEEGEIREEVSALPLGGGYHQSASIWADNMGGDDGGGNGGGWDGAAIGDVNYHHLGDSDSAWRDATAARRLRELVKERSGQQKVLALSAPQAIKHQNHQQHQQHQMGHNELVMVKKNRPQTPASAPAAIDPRLKRRSDSALSSAVGVEVTTSSNHSLVFGVPSAVRRPVVSISNSSSSSDSSAVAGSKGNSDHYLLQLAQKGSIKPKPSAAPKMVHDLTVQPEFASTSSSNQVRISTAPTKQPQQPKQPQLFDGLTAEALSREFLIFGADGMKNSDFLEVFPHALHKLQSSTRAADAVNPLPVAVSPRKTEQVARLIKQIKWYADTEVTGPNARQQLQSALSAYHAELALTQTAEDAAERRKKRFLNKRKKTRGLVDC